MPKGDQPKELAEGDYLSFIDAITAYLHNTRKHSLKANISDGDPKRNGSPDLLASKPLILLLPLVTPAGSTSLSSLL